MSILQTVRKILGSFWYKIFRGLDFLHGVENALALILKKTKASQDRWAASGVAANKDTFDCIFPFAVYIDVDSVTENSFAVLVEGTDWKAGDGKEREKIFISSLYQYIDNKYVQTTGSRAVAGRVYYTRRAGGVSGKVYSYTKLVEGADWTAGSLYATPATGSSISTWYERTESGTYEKTRDIAAVAGKLYYKLTGTPAPGPTLDQLLDVNSGAVLGDVYPAKGYCAKSLYKIPAPVRLSDHIIDFTKTLIEGFDYVYEDSWFKFYIDISKLNLPIVNFTAKDGTPRSYYKLFGWAAESVAVKEMVTEFEDPALNGCADIAWDIHQRGATVYTTKDLLAHATDSVICKEDGAVNHTWVEQGINCMLVGDRVYYSNAPYNYEHGDTVKKGDVLFGALEMYTGASVAAPSALDIPKVKVMTDAGELTADNASLECYEYTLPGDTTSHYVLPLKGGALAVNEYRYKCKELASDIHCPKVDVDNYVENGKINPLLFILQKMRRGTGVLISVVAKNIVALSAAIKCLRKGTNESGIVNVYIQAETDSADVSSTFTAAAGNAAIATVATVKVLDMCAEAEVKL